MGTQILGKEIDPDTKMEFKDMGAKLARDKKKYDKILDGNKGLYATNAAKAMNAKIDSKFTTLFNKQEGQKGFASTRQAALGNISQDVFPTTVDKFAGGGLAGGALSSINSQMFGFGPQSGGVEPWMTQQFGQGQSPINIPGVNIQGQGQSTLGQTPYSPPGATSPQISYQGAGVGGNFGTANGAGLGAVGNAANSAAGFFGNNPWIGKGLGAAAQLGPMAYNFIQGSQPAEHLNAQDFYNPYGAQAIDLMRGRVDVGSQLEANRTAQAIGEYNTKNQGGLSAGAIASNRLAGTAQRMRGDQSVRQWEQNQNLGLQARQAGTMLNVGQQRAQTDFNVANINQQSDAARRGMLGAGFTNLSEYAQMQQLMGNQQRQGQQQLGIMKQMYPFYQKWFGGLNLET
jgi:hypothetical protein